MFSLLSSAPTPKGAKLAWSDLVIRQSFGKPRQAGRLILSFFGYSVRLHYFAPNMDRQPEHEHPWWYLSVVLWGGYVDMGEEAINAPALRFRKPPHRHALRAGPGGCWSVVLTGRTP
jgi:hypothetical protein